MRITQCKRDLALSSSLVLREAIYLVDKQVLSHTINNKHQEGEKMEKWPFLLFFCGIGV
jgi:hypothetical protein